MKTCHACKENIINIVVKNTHLIKTFVKGQLFFYHTPSPNNYDVLYSLARRRGLLYTFFLKKIMNYISYMTCMTSLVFLINIFFYWAGSTLNMGLDGHHSSGRINDLIWGQIDMIEGLKTYETTWWLNRQASVIQPHTPMKNLLLYCCTDNSRQLLCKIMCSPLF